MTKTESITKLAKALVLVQGAIEAVHRDATNPFHKSQYSTLDNVIEKTQVYLTANGIAIIQAPHMGNLKTIIMHESGESMEFETPIVCAKQNDPQALGAAITYLRRYTMKGILKISEVDDDAEGAMNRGQGTKNDVGYTPNTASGNRASISTPGNAPGVLPKRREDTPSSSGAKDLQGKRSEPISSGIASNPSIDSSENAYGVYGTKSFLQEKEGSFRGTFFDGSVFTIDPLKYVIPKGKFEGKVASEQKLEDLQFVLKGATSKTKTDQKLAIMCTVIHYLIKEGKYGTEAKTN